MKPLPVSSRTNTLMSMTPQERIAYFKKTAISKKTKQDNKCSQRVQKCLGNLFWTTILNLNAQQKRTIILGAQELGLNRGHIEMLRQILWSNAEFPNLESRETLTSGKLLSWLFEQEISQRALAY